MVFNNFFLNVFVPDDGNSLHFPSYIDIVMLTPVYLVSDIRKSLSASSSSITCGTDGIPPLLLNKFPELCSPLCNLVNMSLQQSDITKVLETANIVPIFKGKESILEVNNFCPISLTNFFLRLLKGLFLAVLYLIWIPKSCFLLASHILDLAC